MSQIAPTRGDSLGPTSAYDTWPRRHEEGPASASVALAWQPWESQPPQSAHTVNVNVAAPTIVFSQENTGPGFVVRALWFCFIGYWVSWFAVLVAYAVLVFTLGLASPITFAILNRVPYLLTLRQRNREYAMRSDANGVTRISLARQAQRPWYLRAAYFLLVGWWLSAVWIVLAMTIAILIVTIPVSVMMIDRVSGVATLERY